jgi:recombination protein RecR
MASLPRAIINLVNVFERLPGIGPKSATRLAFYLLNTPTNFVEEMADDLVKLKKEIKICTKCFGVSENEVCDICSDTTRNQNQICVVERAIDVIAIENLGGYKGIYHVLGGTINPLNHVGPEDLRIDELIEKLPVDEIILATNPTMEGEATALYIRKKIDGMAKVTRIGSGLPMGADLEFADQATLSRAMDGRTTL